MTFDEANAQYAILQAAWRAGRLSPQDYQTRAAQLRVMDPAGRWWQIDPASGQWMYWTGSAWSLPAPAPAASAPPPAAVPAPRAAPSFRGPGIGEGLMSMAPAVVVEFMQRGAIYKSNPSAVVHFAAPVLLPPVAMALAPRLGRAFAAAIILGCLGWLAWPLIAGPPAASEMMQHAGRGLAGVSMLYMIPRIWSAAARR